MSWSGTVSCRYCGQDGHNRRTCPQRQEWLVRQSEDGNKWAEETLERKNRKAVRKCGWCKEQGHNLRTCPVKTGAYKLVPELKSAVTNLIQKSVVGVGRGAMLRSNNQYGGVDTNVVLKIWASRRFGGTRISEQAVEENSKNNNWLKRVLISLIGNLDYKCVLPSGKMCRVQAPRRPAFWRGEPVRIGNGGVAIIVNSEAPIECDLDVVLNAGADPTVVKGWIKVVNLLLNEVTFEECQ